MVEPRNGKRAQPFTVLDLAGDQDNFLAFGVASFCHGRLRFEKGVNTPPASSHSQLSKYLLYRLRFSEVGNVGGVFRSLRRMIRTNGSSTSGRYFSDFGSV